MKVDLERFFSEEDPFMIFTPNALVMREEANEYLSSIVIKPYSSVRNRVLIMKIKILYRKGLSILEGEGYEEYINEKRIKRLEQKKCEREQKRKYFMELDRKKRERDLLMGIKKSHMSKKEKNKLISSFYNYSI